MTRKGVMTLQLETLLSKPQVGYIELNKLVEQFFGSFKTDVDKHELHKMIYRRLEAKCNSGLFQKLPYNGKTVRYLKTNANLQLDAFKEFENAIDSRVQDYQKELACYEGSCEEYKSLAEKYPELHEELMALYQEADRKRSITLGKLDAIQNAKTLNTR